VWGQGDVALGGSYAEYALIPTATVGPKQKSLSHVEAAASVVAAATAYEVLAGDSQRPRRLLYP